MSATTLADLLPAAYAEQKTSRGIAIHEAGHAVVRLALGGDVYLVEAKSLSGFCRYGNKDLSSEEDAVCDLAGGVANDLADIAYMNASDPDMRQARISLYKAGYGSPDNDFAQAPHIERCKARARDLLARNWLVVHHIAVELIHKGFVNGIQACELWNLHKGI